MTGDGKVTSTYIIKLASLKAIADIDLAEIRAKIRADQKKMFDAIEVSSSAFDASYSAQLKHHFRNALTALEEQQSEFHRRVGLGAEGLREIVRNYINSENNGIEVSRAIEKYMDEDLRD